MSHYLCILCIFFFKIITPYVYELLEKTCNMTRAILPVSTQPEKRRFLLWFIPLKIKGLIKFENWRKCSGFGMILILSVVFNWKEKGIVKSHLSPFCTTLCLSTSLSFCPSPSLSLSPSSTLLFYEKVSPQQINCIVTCHFKDAEAQRADA